MKPFRFSLDHVLSWRRTRLALEESRLERARAELRAFLAAREQVVQVRTQAQARVGLAPSVYGSDLANVETVRQWSLVEARRLSECAAQAQRGIDALERALVEARRRVRLLERLRERRSAAWKAEAERELEELAGESAIAQWRRLG